jgi:hypothetical protein
MEQYPVVVRRTLAAILLDRDAAERAGLDPSKGPLAEELRAKVDGTVYQLEKWEAQIEGIVNNWIAPLKAKIVEIQAKIDRREAAVKKQMELRDMTMLRGNIRKYRIAKNPKKTLYVVSATAEAWEKYPGFVKVSSSYAWDKDEVGNALASGRELPFVKQTQGTNISFKERKKKG